MREQLFGGDFRAGRLRTRSVSSTEGELRAPSVITLKDILPVRSTLDIGLPHAAVSLYTTDGPGKGEQAFFASINHPFAGVVFESLLGAVSPFGNNILAKVDTLGDWRLPIDAAHAGSEDDPNHKRHLNHMKIPGYNEFVDHHFLKWMEVLRNPDMDGFFEQLGATRFINIDEFIQGQRDLPWDIPRKAEFPSHLDRDEEMAYMFKYAYRNEGIEPLMLLDPFAGRGYYMDDSATVPDIITFPSVDQGRTVSFARDGVQAEVTLGEVDSEGFYSVDDLRTTFSSRQRDGALLPLIAWRETPMGKRWFLSQEESVRLLPESTQSQMHGDVFLGRVLLAYLQPDIVATFSPTMPYPHKKDGDEQSMKPQQVPVWVSQPRHEKMLLETDAITQVQEKISGK